MISVLGGALAADVAEVEEVVSVAGEIPSPLPE